MDPHAAAQAAAVANAARAQAHAAAIVAQGRAQERMAVLNAAYAEQERLRNALQQARAAEGQIRRLKQRADERQRIVDAEAAKNARRERLRQKP